MKKSRKGTTPRIGMRDMKPKKQVKGGWGIFLGTSSSSSTSTQPSSQPTESVSLNYGKFIP